MGGDDDGRIAAAMLSAVGELGYETATVQDVVERSGLSRHDFYRRYANKAECFATAYGEEAARLRRSLRHAGLAEDDWIAGARAVLGELLRFVAQSPLPARALLIEVHTARGAALDCYREALDALTHDVDLARQEVESTHYSPPRLTARFIVAAVESAVCALLRADSGATAPSLLPGLVHFVVLYYFGEEAAQRALERT